MGRSSVLLSQGQCDYLQNRDGGPWVLLWSTGKGCCLEGGPNTVSIMQFDGRSLDYEL